MRNLEEVSRGESARDAPSWYECVNCSYQIDVESVQAMPTCPNCNGPRVWEFRSGRHSKDDYPDD